jgi:hypothetical protein
MITKTRQIRDSELMSGWDAWYIDLPAASATLYPPPKPGSFCSITVGTAERDEYKVTDAGKRETGFVLLATRTHRSLFRDESGTVKTHESAHREEVTEFSEASLESSLFGAPLDFKRVPHLSAGAHYPLKVRTRLRWEMLKDSLRLRKRIADLLCR